jgi:hypothetical protein
LIGYWIYLTVTSVVNDPLEAPGSTPFYLCIPPVWATAGGDHLIPHYSWDHSGNQRRKKTGPQDLKEKRDSPSRRSTLEILQQGAGSFGAPLSGPVATSETTTKDMILKLFLSSFINCN